MIEMKFSKEQIKSISDMYKSFERIRFSGGMGNRLPAEAQCVQGGHRVIRITGNMYQCRICAREFTLVGQMDTGELWREFWRRVNAKRKRYGVAWLFGDLLRELEKAQGWT